jgi:hypothetical protein
MPKFGPGAIFMASELTFAGVSIVTRLFRDVQQARTTHPSSLQQAIAEVRCFLQRHSQVRTVIFRNAVFNPFIAFIPTLLPTFGLNVLKVSSGELGLRLSLLFLSWWSSDAHPARDKAAGRA